MLDNIDKMGLQTVEQEIRIKQELLSQMVGWLYPGIILNELEQLYERKDALISTAIKPRN